VIAWEEFLIWASSPGAIPLIVGVLLSILIEYVPTFGGLAPRWKRAAFFGFCLAVPLLAALFGVLTLGWPLSWAGLLWPALVAGALAFGSGTLSHLPKLPDAPFGETK